MIVMIKIEEKMAISVTKCPFWEKINQNFEENRVIDHFFAAEVKLVVNGRNHLQIKVYVT